MKVYVPRLTIREFTEEKHLPEDIIRKKTLASFFPQEKIEKQDYELKIYRQKSIGLLLTTPSIKENTLLKTGDNLQLVETKNQYCKWHDKPIDSEEIINRSYCHLLANPITGFCGKHSRSDKAFYEKCFVINDPGYKKYCKKIDELYKDKIEYVIYLQVTRDLKTKIGVTRKKRFLKRLSEQPHIMGAPIFLTDSAVKARETELYLSKKIGLKQTSKTLQENALTTYLINKAYTIFTEQKKKAFSIRPKGLEPLNDSPIMIYPDAISCSTYNNPGPIIGRLKGFIYNSVIIETNNGCLNIKLNKILHKPTIFI